MRRRDSLLGDGYTVTVSTGCQPLSIKTDVLYRGQKIGSTWVHKRQVIASFVRNGIWDSEIVKGDTTDAIKHIVARYMGHQKVNS